jgi:hypothetical protein
MNRNFEDAWYHLRWAVRHLSRGLREELGPVARRARHRFGDEPEPESDPSRIDRVRRRVRSVEPRRVAGRARERIAR